MVALDYPRIKKAVKSLRDKNNILEIGSMLNSHTYGDEEAMYVAVWYVFVSVRQLDILSSQHDFTIAINIINTFYKTMLSEADPTSYNRLYSTILTPVRLLHHTEKMVSRYLVEYNVDLNAEMGNAMDLSNITAVHKFSQGEKIENLDIVKDQLKSTMSIKDKQRKLVESNIEQEMIKTLELMSIDIVANWKELQDLTPKENLDALKDILNNRLPYENNIPRQDMKNKYTEQAKKAMLDRIENKNANTK